MAQAFITKNRLREFDKTLGQVIEHQEGMAVEQALIVKNLLKNREYLGEVVKVTISGPERVVEALVSLIGGESFDERG